MTRIVTILTPGFADWETALLNAGAREFYRVETLFASAGGEPITSLGGMHVMPNLAIETIDINEVDALLVNGGTIWQTPSAPDLAPLLRNARDAGRVVGGICDGVIALARAGVLDERRHTANGPESLPETGYAGGAHFINSPRAVLDRRVATAPGTAPVSFMSAVFEALGMRDGNLDFYLGLYATEHLAA